ncbi:hypothetical protein ACC680_27680 [Rhizobium ruizarguesonis]
MDMPGTIWASQPIYGGHEWRLWQQVSLAAKFPKFCDYGRFYVGLSVGTRPFFEQVSVDVRLQQLQSVTCLEYVNIKHQTNISEKLSCNHSPFVLFICLKRTLIVWSDIE